MVQEVFLTREEKYNLSKWSYACVDNSITTQLFTPWWNWCVKFVPETVAPNILSLSGMIFILYFFHLAYNFADEKNSLVSFAGIILMFGYRTLDAIDGKHARNTGNGSPLGELFDHSCDNFSVPFCAVAFTLCVGISDLTVVWYMVQTAQLLFLLSHVDAFAKRVVEFGRWTGPGEALCVYMFLLLLNGIYGTEWVAVKLTEFATAHGMTLAMFGIRVWSGIYYITWLSFTFYVLRMDKKHGSTKKGLLISLCVRSIPAIFLYTNLIAERLTIFNVISDGVIISVLCGDMIVAKMASRDLHPLVPIVLMISSFDNFLCFLGTMFYYTVIFLEISTYLKLPIFGVKRVVFINGVFDLFHRAHLRLVREAAREGTYLIVGVLTEEDVLTYKPKLPAMTFQQRWDAVKDCGYVDEVIQTPLYIRGEEGDEFMKKYRINCVMCSSEYDTTEDEYYESPRRQGKLVVLPRMEGISTTALKRQVYERCPKKDLD